MPSRDRPKPASYQSTLRTQWVREVGDSGTYGTSRLEKAIAARVAKADPKTVVQVAEGLRPLPARRVRRRKPRED